MIVIHLVSVCHRQSYLYEPFLARYDTFKNTYFWNSTAKSEYETVLSLSWCLKVGRCAAARGKKQMGKLLYAMRPLSPPPSLKLQRRWRRVVRMIWMLAPLCNKCQCLNCDPGEGVGRWERRGSSGLRTWEMAFTYYDAYRKRRGRAAASAAIVYIVGSSEWVSELASCMFKTAMHVH